MADSIQIHVTIGNRTANDNGDVMWSDTVSDLVLITATTRLNAEHARECQRRLGEVLKRMVGDG